MQCPACQNDNPEASRFCNACGASLERECAACGGTNPPGSRFCNGCGGELTDAQRSSPAARGSASPASAAAEADRVDERSQPISYTPKHLADRILTQKAALEGERRNVTVLFADLAESTAVAERLGDPEEMHALLDQAFQLMLEEVHAVEGTINQFTGDGVMALFGAPIALEDAPRRAVAAALAIQRALEPLDERAQALHGERFRMRIGIHTGLVVVGSIGDDLRMDYTAVGDTTNLAARLQTLAAPGAVVVSEATSRLVEGYFDVEPLPPAELKGKAEPVQAYHVTGARPVTGRIDAATGSGEGLTHYVGRNRELDTLLEAFEQAKEGRGQVAFVVGEAGFGKSRLLHEFRRRLESESHVWIEGRCASFAQSTPFHAVADSVRRLHQIEDHDDDATIQDKLGARDDLLGQELMWTRPHLRGLLSLPTEDAEVDALDAMTRRAEMCRAMHARIVRTAEQVPTILVVEDLHWVDAATEEFMAFVTDTIAAARVLVVLTHRPGYTHNFGDRSYHVRVPLQPLSEGAMSAMVSSVLDSEELPAPVRGSTLR